MSSIIIKHAAVYHPQNAVGNGIFIEKLKKQNEEIESFLNALGRRNRYIGVDENSLTMAVKASNQALKEANLTGKDVDMIVFSSATPEYLSPPTSTIIHNELGGKERCIVYDINVNCVGMIVALDQVSRYMKSHPHIHRALIVGAEQLHRFSKKSDVITYPNFGDASCAVILEKVEEDGIGFIDSEHYVDSKLAFEIKNPACGLSNILSSDSSDDKKIYWSPFDTDEAFRSARQSIERLLHNNGYSKENVKKYFVSQFSVKNIRDLSIELKEDIGKFIYIGDEFGYTGTSSPFIAFTKSIEKKELRENDIAIFWSVGAGVTACTVVYKYVG